MGWAKNTCAKNHHSIVQEAGTNRLSLLKHLIPKKPNLAGLKNGLHLPTGHNPCSLLKLLSRQYEKNSTSLPACMYAFLQHCPGN